MGQRLESALIIIVQFSSEGAAAGPSCISSSSSSSSSSSTTSCYALSRSLPYSPSSPPYFPPPQNTWMQLFFILSENFALWSTESLSDSE